LVIKASISVLPWCLTVAFAFMYSSSIFYCHFIQLRIHKYMFEILNWLFLLSWSNWLLCIHVCTFSETTTSQHETHYPCTCWWSTDISRTMKVSKEKWTNLPLSGMMSCSHKESVATSYSMNSICKHYWLIFSETCYF